MITNALAGAASRVPAIPANRRRHSVYAKDSAEGTCLIRPRIPQALVITSLTVVIQPWRRCAKQSSRSCRVPRSSSHRRERRRRSIAGFHGEDERGIWLRPSRRAAGREGLRRFRERGKVLNNGREKENRTRRLRAESG